VQIISPSPWVITAAESLLQPIIIIIILWKSNTKMVFVTNIFLQCSFLSFETLYSKDKLTFCWMKDFSFSSRYCVIVIFEFSYFKFQISNGGICQIPNLLFKSLRILASFALFNTNKIQKKILPSLIIRN